MSSGPSPQRTDAATTARLTLVRNLGYTLVVALVLTLACLLLRSAVTFPTTFAKEETSIDGPPLIVNHDQPEPRSVESDQPAPHAASSNRPVPEPLSAEPLPLRHPLSPSQVVKPGDPFGKDLAPAWEVPPGWNTNVILRTMIVEVPASLEVDLSPENFRQLHQFAGVDLLTAPSVAARPGQQARAEIFSEVPYLNPATREIDTLPVGVTIDFMPTPPQDLDPSATLAEVAGRPITLQAVLTINGFAGYTGADPSIGYEGVPTAHQSQLDTVLVLEPGRRHGVTAFRHQQIAVTEDKVPVLGDIPYLGEFFRNRVETTTERQSYLFISFDWAANTGKTLSQATE